MTRSIQLTPELRAGLLDRYRRDPQPAVRSRSHLLLLLDDGHSWVTVASILFYRSRTIDHGVKRFAAEGMEGLGGHQLGRPFRFAAEWIGVVVEWVTETVPGDFGFLRSRWSCGTLALLIRDLHGIVVGPETVRRWLHAGCLVYRRPRPHHIKHLEFDDPGDGKEINGPSSNRRRLKTRTGVGLRAVTRRLGHPLLPSRGRRKPGRFSPSRSALRCSGV